MTVHRLIVPIILALLLASPTSKAVEKPAADDPLFLESLSLRPFHALLGLIKIQASVLDDRSKSESLLFPEYSVMENTTLFALSGYAPVIGRDCRHVASMHVPISDGAPVPLVLGVYRRSNDDFVDLEDTIASGAALIFQPDSDLKLAIGRKVVEMSHYARSELPCQLLRIEGSRFESGKWIPESRYVRLWQVKRLIPASSLQHAMDLRASVMATLELEAQKRDADARAAALNDFRTHLKIGDATNCGLVIDVRHPIAQIQGPNKTTWVRLDALAPSNSGTKCSI